MQGNNMQNYNNQGMSNQGINNQGYDNQGYNNQNYNNQGYPNQTYDNQQYNNQNYNNMGYNNQTYNTQDDYFGDLNLPAQYKPLSPWAYFGYQILFAVPLIGFIMAIVYAFNKDNINRRNFARAYLFILAIGIVMAILMLILGISSFSYLDIY